MLYAALGLKNCIAMVFSAWSVFLRLSVHVIRLFSGPGLFHEATLNTNSRNISMI